MIYNDICISTLYHLWVYIVSGWECNQSCSRAGKSPLNLTKWFLWLHAFRCQQIEERRRGSDRGGGRSCLYATNGRLLCMCVCACIVRAAHNYTLWGCCCCCDAKRKSPAIPIPISIRETNHNSSDSHSDSDSGSHSQITPDSLSWKWIEFIWKLAWKLRSKVWDHK